MGKTKGRPQMANWNVLRTFLILFVLIQVRKNVTEDTQRIRT